MSFLGGWLSGAWVLGVSLAAALASMQAPAFTDAYAAALLQVASDARRDVDQRIASARRHYALEAQEDAEIVAALGTVEPSNAETLAASIDRSGALRAAYERIAAAPPLLRPAAALLDAGADPHGHKREILRLAALTFAPAIQLSLAALAYAFAGVLLGSLLAHLVVLALGGAGRRLGARWRRHPTWYAAPPRPRRG
jgi:Protein of unknown function (DUF2937)